MKGHYRSLTEKGVPRQSNTDLHEQQLVVRLSNNINDRDYFLEAS